MGYDAANVKQTPGNELGKREERETVTSFLLPLCYDPWGEGLVHSVVQEFNLEEVPNGVESWGSQRQELWQGDRVGEAGGGRGVVGEWQLEGFLEIEALRPKAPS